MVFDFEGKGDIINFVKCVTAKSTHEQRGGRLVKVRYEPILKTKNHARKRQRKDRNRMTKQENKRLCIDN